MNIPKEHYRFILGAKGKKLAELELETATKILIPRQEDPSEVIRITGNKEGLDRAMHEIQLISDEQVWPHSVFLSVYLSLSVSLCVCGLCASSYRRR